MTVKEAIELFAYGTDFEIQGAYSGKIYHRSWKNKREHAEKFFNETVPDEPYYTKLYLRGLPGPGERCEPAIGIWMHDYEICKEKGGGNE